MVFFPSTCLQIRHLTSDVETTFPEGKNSWGSVRSSKELPHAASVNNPIISAMQYVALTWLLFIISTVTSEFGTHFTTAPIKAGGCEINVYCQLWHA